MSDKESYHSAEYGGDRLSSSGDIMVSVCHVTFKDHVTKDLFNFMVCGPSR